MFSHVDVFKVKKKIKILAVELEAQQDYLAGYNTEKHKQEKKYCIRSIKTCSRKLLKKKKKNPDIFLENKMQSFK